MCLTFKVFFFFFYFDTKVKHVLHMTVKLTLGRTNTGHNYTAASHLSISSRFLSILLGTIAQAQPKLLVFVLILNLKQM